MNFTILRLFLYKWLWGLTASGKLGIYKLMKRHNPQLTEKELSLVIFNQNFETLSCPQERARGKTYLNKYTEPSNLLETCIAIVMIEFGVDVNDKESYEYIKKVLLIKLYNNGYQIKGDK